MSLENTAHPPRAVRSRVLPFTLKASALLIPVFALLAFSLRLSSQIETVVVKDPGVRPYEAYPPTPVAGLTPGELDFFSNVGIPQFTQVEQVADGLGPRFNLNSCSGCHAYPTVGGSSPAINPQVALLATFAPSNRAPYFLSLNGPIREMRYLRNIDGTPDGGVHSLFTITGRPDGPAACAIQQPNFSDASNMTFRIPTPLYGAGLIESIPDSTIRANLLADPDGAKARHRIHGRANSHAVGGTLNTNPNDDGVSRFGWKAQNKSLTVFAGEAYNVEMGVTNEVFPNEREDDPNCTSNATPENDAHFAVGNVGPSDVAAFRGLMRFLAPPEPACIGMACSPSIRNGHALAAKIGCLSCHTETLMTGVSSTAALSQVPVNLYSDLALHHMGEGLEDGVSQGRAGPDEFRSAPLWGLGQRIFLLHDGRTSDLLVAIKAHESSGSEANQVVENFERLTPAQKMDLLRFLRSL